MLLEIVMAVLLSIAFLYNFIHYVNEPPEQVAKEWLNEQKGE